jgi:hypothetical protein
MARTNDPNLLAQGFGNTGWFVFDGEIYFDNESVSSVRLNHAYGYADQNPIRWVDPSGLLPGFGMPLIRDHISGLGDHISEPNGNVFPGHKPQDYMCSSIACVLNRFPSMVKRCIAHDKCYEKNKCNASSWISNVMGGTKSCNQCNSSF